MFPDLLAGFQGALEPSNLLFVVLGTIVGIAVGSVPGLDCSVGTALVLPLTFAMTPTQAIIFLAGLYSGGVYGGQIPAILFRVPGASEAVMTTLDGYPMAQQGRAGKALGVGLDQFLPWWHVLCRCACVARSAARWLRPGVRAPGVLCAGGAWPERHHPAWVPNPSPRRSSQVCWAF